MLKIGLTGGIGCGKSTVCNLFRELGATIIDADIIAKELVMPGLPTLERLVEIFGTQILLKDGCLDRSKLRDLVFQDPTMKQQLEKIMHPPIYRRITEEFENAHGLYCIAAIPLLLETGQSRIVDRVLIIDCRVTDQIERVMKRDGLAYDRVLSIIDSQMQREQRLALADDVIDNSTVIAQLAEQVKRLHNSYNLLATVRTPPA